MAGSLVSETAYALTTSTDITENTRYQHPNYLLIKIHTRIVMSQFDPFDFFFIREIFPEGLPPSYVFVATLRLKGTSSQLIFDLWRVLSKSKQIQAAVTLNGKDQSVIFTTTSVTENEQKVIFKRGFKVSIKTILHECIYHPRSSGQSLVLKFWLQVKQFLIRT